ncbi:hypothetical protein QQF64_003714 [Cirrhinus molitorella]|uniref:Uncharacterized protein n=1 Tax=Cirrhinus molitorella TaxID=172907 RepID=A0ABR3MM49_9TELE
MRLLGPFDLCLATDESIWVIRSVCWILNGIDLICSLLAGEFCEAKSTMSSLNLDEIEKQVATLTQCCSERVWTR